MDDCLFCGIVAGQVPCDDVADSELCVAIRDKYPAAPVHVLVLPRKHLTTIADISEGPNGLLDEMFALANEVAEKEGIAETGYRLVFNKGKDSGMVVPHLHLHVLGGAHLGPVSKAGDGSG